VSDELDAAARYRERAEELRTISGNCKDARNRLIFGRVAEDYERMAKTMEHIHTLLHEEPQPKHA
jgi:hypothetical protein